MNIRKFFFFQEGAGNESCNQTGSFRGPDFPISAHGHGNGFIHKFVCCLWMSESCDFVRFSFKPWALRNKKVNFIIQTKYLKGESSKSVGKTGFCFPTLATLVKVWLNCFQVTGHKCSIFFRGRGAFYWGKSIKHYSSILLVAFFQIFLTENNNGNIFERNESLNSKFQKNILYSSLTP